MNPAQVATVVSEIGERYRDEYLDPKLGAEVFRTLNLQILFGEYTHVDGDSLATRLTADLRSVTRDIHSFVKYRPGDDVSVGESVIREEIFQPGIDGVEKLAGNIGYIRITLFADPRSFSKQVDSAMRVLSRTRALIIDLRDAPGGSSQSVAYLSSHFFEPEPRVHLNSFVFRNGPTIDEWTRRVPTPYLGRDVLVLISKRTGSAAEGFAFQMQAFGRARIVGERSKGGAHTGRHSGRIWLYDIHSDGICPQSQDEDELGEVRRAA